MALKNVIRASNDRDAQLREESKDRLFRGEKAYRVKEFIQAWSDVKGIGEKLSEMSFNEAGNIATNLNLQAGHLANLTEAQRSSAFAPFTPDNMLRLVVLSFPQTSRDKVFSTFGMESAKDSIKFVRPVIGKTDNGLDPNDKAALYASLDDPFGINNGSSYGNSYDVEDLDSQYSKALYESAEARYSSDLINAPYVVIADTTATFVFGPATAGDTKAVGGGTVTDDDIARSQKWVNNSYEGGYTVVYGATENDPIAQQSKRTGAFLINPKYADVIESVATGTSEDGYPTIVVTLKDGATMPTAMNCFGRCNSEGDTEGQTIPNIELVMTDVTFKPRETALGVSWTNLTQIVMDASFGLSTKDLMLRAAADAIACNLDYRAFKLAYTRAKMLPEAYHVKFDAKGGESDIAGLYTYNAQTITTAIETIADNMLNKLKRGGVSSLVAGPSAGAYLTLSKDFDFTGKEAAAGVFKYGQIAKMPVFKAPSDIIPTNEIVTNWVNPNNPSDTSVIFATLVPFFSTGAIQRKNMYVEAGISSYGDVSIICPYFLGIIEIENLKDTTSN